MIRNYLDDFITDPNGKDFFLELAKGNISGHLGVNKFGRNSSVGTTFETVWDAGGVYNWDTTAGTATLLSTSTSDASKVITVEGVTSNFTKFSTEVTLDATDPTVNTATIGTDVKHIYSMYANTSSLVGDVTATLDGSTVAKILYDNNQTLMSTYVVPAGKTGYVVKGITATGKGKSAEVQFRARTNDTVFRTVHVTEVYENNYDYDFPIPLQIPEKTVLEVRAKAAASSTPVSTVFDIILVDNQ